jgi:hypothetical protein
LRGQYVYGRVVESKDSITENLNWLGEDRMVEYIDQAEVHLRSPHGHGEQALGLEFSRKCGFDVSQIRMHASWQVLDGRGDVLWRTIQTHQELAGRCIHQGGHAARSVALDSAHQIGFAIAHEKLEAARRDLEGLGLYKRCRDALTQSEELVKLGPERDEQAEMQILNSPIGL